MEPPPIAVDLEAGVPIGGFAVDPDVECPSTLKPDRLWGGGEPTGGPLRHPLAVQIPRLILVAVAARMSEKD